MFCILLEMFVYVVSKKSRHVQNCIGKERFVPFSKDNIANHALGTSIFVQKLASTKSLETKMRP